MTLPKNKSSFKQIFSLHGDRTLWAIFFILCAISFIEVYSAASTLTFKQGIFGPIMSHLKFLIIGFVAAWIFHNIPCRFFKLWGPAWFIFAIMLLYLCIFGSKVNDGARWISLFGIKFQPSEFAKGSLVVMVAMILSTYQTKKGTDRHAFKYIMIFTGITCALIFTENFSTAGILFLVITLMMIFGRVAMKTIGKLYMWLAIVGIGLIFMLKILPVDKITEVIPPLHRVSNFVSRIDKFFGNSKDAETDSTKQTKAFDFDINEQPQVGHARIAIAKSHIIGCGPGNSRERDFLPQAYSDFIFAIILEELGLLGGAVIILLYIILLFRASKIANRCERTFPALMMLGLAILIVIQAAVNMSVAVGLMPVTGQPLPLISRGGSSIIVTSIYFGMMISISRFAKKRPDAQPQLAEENAESVPEEEPVVHEEEFQKDDGIE